jgi:DNA polymerase III subunit epsilon
MTRRASTAGRRARSLWQDLPDTPGVYLFYGVHNELLYVGKSKTIRTRVRSHFAIPQERTMCRNVRRIEAQTTAGELGALLLEAQLIKKLRPMYNRRSRHTRRILIARRAIHSVGYTGIHLEAVRSIDPEDSDTILAVFRTRTQAEEYLATIARTHRLCPKLLGLERTTRSCFSYHLHRCDGACIGKEKPETYNARVDLAFEERRIKAWPFDGGVIIEEIGECGREVFLVDHWCLMYSYRVDAKSQSLKIRGPYQFDFDAYRILAGYVFEPSHVQSIQEVSREEFASLLKKLRAA